MRSRFVLIIKGAGAALALLFLAACGGGTSTPKTSGPGIPSLVTIGPSSTSLTRGQTVSFTGSVLDVNNSPVTSQTISFQSSNTAVLTIANSGLACAGTWDSLTTPIVCTPGPTGTVTVTAVSGTLSSSTATVYVHDRIDTVTVAPTNPSCVTSGALLQFTAKAFAAGKDITAQAGPFVWNSTNSSVGGIDQTGLATAGTPGIAGIFASINGVNSQTVPYGTCLVSNIALTSSSGGNSFATDISTNQTLSVTITDTSGAVLPNASAFLTFSINSAAIGGMTGNTFLSSAAGSGTVVASCTPPTCNVGSKPVYSNAMLGTVNGASTTTVYVASNSSTNLIPIDVGTNTAGTAITLPTIPNSLIINTQGTRAYLGTDTVLMIVDLTANSISTIANVAGRVIGTSADGNTAFIANSVNHALYVVNTTTGQLESFLAPGALRMAFSPDGYKSVIVGSNSVFTYSPAVPFRTEVFPATVNDVAFLASGPVAFLAGGSATPALNERMTCDNSPAASIPAPGNISRIAPLPDGSGMVGVDNQSFYRIPVTVATSLVPCPPAVSASVTTTSMGAGVFAPNTLLVAPNGNEALIFANGQTQLLVFNLISGTPSAIPLTGSPTLLSGGITLDSAFAYVGGSDNNVHRIDLNAGTDTQQISVSITPNFVAVKP